MGTREKAKAALGPKFEIKAFYDAILANGWAPMAVSQHVSDDRIAGRGAAKRAHADPGARPLRFGSDRTPGAGAVSK